MQKTAVEIADGFYQSTSLPLNAQRCVNWWPVVPELSGLSTRALLEHPGITQFAYNDTGVFRGCENMGGIAYFVNGGYLYSVSSTGVSTRIGVISGSGYVSMANNGYKLAIVVPGDTLYEFNSTANTLTEVSDVDYIVSDSVSYVDGYYIYTASDGSVFFNSALNDPMNFDALDFGTAEIDPDPIVSSHVNHNQLFVLGTDTIELFQNVGGSGFPFQRIDGGSIQKGCTAKFSVVEFDNTFLFVGGGINERSAIWKVVGSSQVQKVSTAAIDFQIQQFTAEEISTAFAWTYSWQGGFFAGFTFESTRIPSRTFVYDATASAFANESVWHERQTGSEDNRWRVGGILKAYGKILVGDNVDGRVGEFDQDAYTDYEEPRYRMKTSRPFFQDELPLFQGQMELTMESGTGLESGDDPQIDFDYSDDGARTWSYPTARGYGKTGEYQRLCIWRKLGRIPRHRVLRFKTSEPVKSNLLKLCAYASVGTQ